MRRSSGLSGLLGLVFLAFALVDYLIASGLQLFVLINLVFGVFAVVIWATSNRAALSTLTGRKARYGLNEAAYTLLFVGLVIVVNFLSARYHRRFDLTAEHAFSLSSQSVKVVQELKKPLKLYGFVPGGQSERARTLYESYAYASARVSFMLVDPDRHPELAERFKVSVMNTTHLQYGGDDGTGTNVTEMTEQALTNAILKLIKSGTKTVCFTGGHGEANPDDAQSERGFGEARKALEGENYRVKRVVLASQKAVPQECNLLVVAGPARALLAQETDEINAYLKAGGRLLALLRPPRPDGSRDETALVKLTADWGVKAGDDIIVDQVVRLFSGPALGLNPLVTSYGRHPITDSFTHQTVFPMARSLSEDSTGKKGLVVTALAMTSRNSWAETDLKDLFERQVAQLGKEDRKGPLAVAEAVSADLAQAGGKGQARLVVVGSTDFADNHYFYDFFNRDFFLNCTDWLAGESSSISIRPKALRASRVNLTVNQFSTIFALSVLLLPELLLIGGVIVWWERRN
jgi:ABC-type uncharacterized transport system involved in gliding motility auxiliary subunit